MDFAAGSDVAGFAAAGSSPILGRTVLVRAGAGFSAPAARRAARLVLRAAGEAFLADLRADTDLLREAVFRRAPGLIAAFLRVSAVRFAVFLVDFLPDFFADFDFRAVAIVSSCFRSCTDLQAASSPSRPHGARLT
jgi:hypothetical protein